MAVELDFGADNKRVKAQEDNLSRKFVLKSRGAAIVGVCNRTLDAYERRGMVTPIRTLEGFKLYRVEELERLAAERGVPR